MTRPILIPPKLLEEAIEELRILGYIYAYETEDPLSIARHRKIQTLIHQLERRRDRGKIEEVAVK